MKNKIIGIGLLELLLAFSIIAVLLISATRYYQSAQNSRQVQAALDTIQAIYYAGAQHVESVGVFAHGTDYIGDSDFVNHGFLPSNFGDGSKDNPWGGAITAGSAIEGDSTQLKLTLANVPSAACINLTDKLNSSKFIDPKAVINCDVNPITIIFTDYMKIPAP